jgi:histidinol dehydrogenase
VLDFVKGITVQELSPAGLQGLGPVAVELAMLEGLDAHANAVTRRLDVLNRTGHSANVGLARGGAPS